MLDIPTLDALDLSLWLQSGVEAARVSDCVPSTIVRRVDTALSTLGLTLRRSRNGWSLRGDQELLHLEREIHQLHRFQGGGRLRLELPCWTLQQLQGELPSRWLGPPLQERPPCGNPVDLLRRRVIDAALMTPTQLASAGLPCPDSRPLHQQGLQVHALYSSQIQLYGCSEDPDLPLPEDVIGAWATDQLSLKLPQFLPLSCQEACRLRFRNLTPAGARRRLRSLPATIPWSACFLTPQMAALLPPHWQPLATPLDWPYSETLVVLEEHAAHPQVLELLSFLAASLGTAVEPAALPQAA